MKRPDSLVRRRSVVRGALVLGALAAAVWIAPVGKEAPVADTSPTDVPKAPALRADERRLLETGRASPLVGKPTPEIAFTTFDGAPIELHGRTRPVVLMFFGDPCVECDAEMGKLAVLSTVLFDEIWSAALASEGVPEIERAYTDAGAAELMYGGPDAGGAIARAFGVDRFPATVVVDADAKVAAVWKGAIPAAIALNLIEDL